MPYLGNTPTTQNFISGTDYFNGTGSATAFTLTRAVASVNDIEAVVNNVVQQPNDAYTISGTTITFTSAPSAGTSNVYVRYLSTTTQAITPSQGTVSWSTLDANTQQDLGISFKNRIINGAMVIDQRNAGASVDTTTTGNPTFTLDRWAYQCSVVSKFTVQQNAGSVTPPVGFANYLGATSSSAYTVGASELFLLTQSVEGLNCTDLGWGTANAKTVTMSFWVRSSLTGTFGGSLSNSAFNRSYPFSYTVSTANTWQQISVTIAGDTSGTWLTTNGIGIRVYFGLGVGSTYSGTAGAWTGSGLFSTTGATSVVGTNGATWYITGVQLEVGTQATTFTTAGGSYGAELLLCQRYYYQMSGAGPYVRFGIGPANQTTAAIITNQFQTIMRAVPSSITYSGAFAVWAGATIFSSSSLVLDTTSTGQNAGVLAAATTGLAIGTTYQLIGNNDSAAKLGYSAEL